MWLDILLSSNIEDTNSEKEAKGSQRIQVKGHHKGKNSPLTSIEAVEEIKYYSRISLRPKCHKVDILCKAD